MHPKRESAESLILEVKLLHVFYGLTARNTRASKDVLRQRRRATRVPELVSLGALGYLEYLGITCNVTNACPHFTHAHPHPNILGHRHRREREQLGYERSLTQRQSVSSFTPAHYSASGTRLLAHRNHYT